MTYQKGPSQYANWCPGNKGNKNTYIITMRHIINDPSKRTTSHYL